MFVRYFLHFLVCIKSTSVLSDLVKFELKYVSQGAILNTVQGLSKISCYLRCKNQHGCMYTGYESCKGKDICLSNTKVCFSLNSPGTDNVPNNKEPYWRLEVGQPIAQVCIFVFFIRDARWSFTTRVMRNLFIVFTLLHESCRMSSYSSD